MLKLKWTAHSARALLASIVLTSLTLLLPLAALAQTAQLGTVTAGTTPFVAVASASYSGGTLASVSYSITPLGNSVTRPLSANYSANYLGVSSASTSGSVSIPIFGLYAGNSNTVNITFSFTNGSSVGPISTSISTASYTDPCLAITLNESPFNQLSRPTQSDLSYDYFLLKTDCANSPEIRDTDGNLRWVGSAGTNGGVEDPALINNAIFASDNSTSLDRIDITTGTKTTLANYSSVGVTATNQHNIDPGRNGMLLEVNTTSETEATILEINPATGAILNTWDMGAIISAAMSAAGDNPANFVLGTSGDWFHNNATTYNPADNTLIVSSREDFVIAVDYDPPASGQRRIHWILGDPTKAWHSYPSLASYALNLGSNTLPPIGQHGISIDHLGNLLMFDDGLGSLTLSPAGVSRNYSAVRSYQINTSAMTATEVYTYTLADGAYAGGNVFSPICGSVYDVGGNYLVDYATANPAAAAASQNGTSTVAGNNSDIDNTLIVSNNQTSVIFAGLGAGALQGTTQNGFVMQILPPTATCLTWNAVPLPSNVFTFNGYVNAGAVTAAPGTSGSVAVAISGLSSAPTTLGLNGTAAVNSPIPYNLGGNSGTITAQFSSVTSTSASLNVTVPTTVLPSTIPYSIPVTIGNSQVGIVTLIVPLAPQTIMFPTISAQTVGTPLSLAATASSGLTVSYASSTTSVCTVSGSTTSFVAPGTCTITATQSGNATYAAASVSQSFTVQAAAASVNVTLAPVTLAQGSYNAFTAAISGASVAPTTLGLGGVPCVNIAGCLVDLSGGSIPLNFEFFNVSNNGASLGIFVSTSVPPGSYAIPITIGTTPVGKLTLTVPQLTQTISFGAITAQTVGTQLSLAATASSGLTVSYASSTTSVCTVSGSTASFVAPGTCTITASQAGNATYAAAISVSQSFNVAAANAGSFTLTPASTSVTVTPPSCFFVFCTQPVSGTDTVTVAPAGGFTGSVTFSISGLPTGVTAAFSPASVTTRGSTTLKLTPASSAASSKSTKLTITGTSGSVSATTTVTVNY
jgi:hypothetical protein